MAEIAPEPDRIDGAPHPRETRHLFGQDQAERDFLTAFNADRLHHAWLITGPRGTGKATLAWRIARFLLATPAQADDGLFGAPPPPASLDIDPEHPVARRILARSEPGLFLLRRGGSGTSDSEQQKNFADGKFSTYLRVDEVRKLAHFFSMSSADGGRRVVIVDAADEMNAQAANALLKMLEEPPARATLLLIAHQPASLLPTIKSRCRSLRLSPLGHDDMAAALMQAEADIPPDEAEALTLLSEGSVGTAIRLHHQDGLALYRQILLVLASLPRLDRSALLTLADGCSGKGREDRLALTLTLADRIAARLARTGVLGEAPAPIVPGEAEILRRLSPDPARGRAWAQAIQDAGDRARHARSVNVDPALLVTDLFLHLQQAA
ncbi:DNA polymerase III subunit delta' [Sagittula salina]|uniref:DNA polymerase III subunit delta n=1 Tax=Sagittula salina TaxID=2820268 RepID=A0A940MLS3_9RHOB|nr:DNA polymerase III subunit delta' [Sagittula salina]MBP0484180.1 DNA polymerase III subunit delta' [Sagittula salina]